MMVPNFATRPFLNTRPVWVVAIAAGFTAIVLGLVNVQLFLESNQALATQIELRDRLVGERSALNDGLEAEVRALNSVRWRELSERVETLNVVIEAHAFSWLNLLDDLEATLPYGVRVISISPTVDDGGVYLALDAVARTRGDMLDFLDRLIADPHFDDPLPGKEVWPETSMTVGYLFNLEMSYRPSAGSPQVEAEPGAGRAEPAVEEAAPTGQVAAPSGHSEVAP